MVVCILQFSDSRLHNTDCCFQIAVCSLKFADYSMQIAICLLQFADGFFRLQFAEKLKHTTGV